MRDSQREYNGPPLISDTAIQAENDRLMKLQKEFNKIAARWSRIRQEANIKYLGWSNSKLEKMFKEAEEDLVHEDFNHIELKDSIANAEGNNMKFRNYGKTGSGNGFENYTTIDYNNYQSTKVKEIKKMPFYHSRPPLRLQHM